MDTPSTSWPDLDGVYLSEAMMWNHGFWMGPWMWLISLAVFIGFIVVAVWIVRWIGQGPPPRSTDTSQRDRALEILRERYARGEISREEFERMQRDLRRSE